MVHSHSFIAYIAAIREILDCEFMDDGEKVRACEHIRVEFMRSHHAPIFTEIVTRNDADAIKRRIAESREKREKEARAAERHEAGKEATASAASEAKAQDPVARSSSDVGPAGGSVVRGRRGRHPRLS